MTDITLEQLTAGTIEGDGVFDTLMQTMSAHLDAQYKAGRIKGTDYANVYLGSLNAVMQTAMQFMLQKDQAAAQAALLNEQVTTEQANQRLVEQNIKTGAAQQAQIEQQTENLVAEKAKTLAETDQLAIQARQIESQIAINTQQLLNLTAEEAQIRAQTDHVGKQSAQVVQQTANLVEEKERIKAQTEELLQQVMNLASQKLQIEAQTDLTEQQTANALTENTTMLKQQCKLDAEYDLLLEQKLQTVAQTALVTQKKATEKAQITASGVDADSVIGRQKGLYKAQADGFTRDAEQKMAKILVDSWNVRRTTDEGTVADGTNKLSDEYVGRAIDSLLAGVNA